MLAKINWNHLCRRRDKGICTIGKFIARCLNEDLSMGSPINGKSCQRKVDQSILLIIKEMNIPTIRCLRESIGKVVCIDLIKKLSARRLIKKPDLGCCG